VPHLSRAFGVDAANVHDLRRALVLVLGIDPGEWTTRELHSFVSVRSGADIPLEQIARPIGHSDTIVAVAVLIVRS
jgi:hypothetical protein